MANAQAIWSVAAGRGACGVGLNALVVLALLTGCAGRRQAGSVDSSVGSPSGPQRASAEAGYWLPNSWNDPPQTRLDPNADAGPLDFDPTLGFIHMKFYQCCAKGEGRACCGSDAGYGSCLEYQDCATEGQLFDAKFLCLACCKGLRQIGLSSPDDAGICTLNGGAPPGAVICSPCGDGVCQSHENACNCPSDCR